MTAIALQPNRPYEIEKSPASPALSLVKGSRRQPTRHAHLGSSLLGIAGLVATYFAASALVAARPSSPSELSGSVKHGSVISYTVQPGDSVWSIASRLEPNADPRALVDELTARLGTSTLYAGEQLHITLH